MNMQLTVKYSALFTMMYYREGQQIIKINIIDYEGFFMSR